MGETGRERELGESRGPFCEEGGLRPRKGGFRAEEEGIQEGDPACRSAGNPTPHLGLGGGLLGVHILPRLWLGEGKSREAGHQCLRQEVTEVSSHFRELWPGEGQ